MHDDTMELKPAAGEAWRVEIPRLAIRRPLRRTVDLAMPGRGRREYYIRGGVCWPQGGHPEQYGALVVGAQDVEDKTVFAIAEGRFLTVEPCVDPTTGTMFAGCAARFNEVWQRFYCRSFYFREDEGEHRKWLLECLRCGGLEPKPECVRADWREKATDMVVDRWLTVGRLALAQEGPTFAALSELRMRPGTDGYYVPPVRALAALLAGLERSPWRYEHVVDLPA